ncbi:MAG: sulfatase [Akkermansiaceae bacterium]|nr:sulfatase [Akkermansiaceae bacterium]
MPTMKYGMRALVSAVLMTWSATGIAVAAEPGKPNILFIIIDDMGWKDIGIAGSTYYETPNIDRLAGEGMYFTNAYSAAPTCSPSRGAILTGKAPARTQFTAVYDGSAGPDDRLQEKSKYRGENDQNFEALHRHALPKSEVLIAEALRDGGYTTGLFGKWHAGECDGYFPDQRGFDVAKGYRKIKAPTSKSGHWMKTFRKFGANLDDADPDAYLADVLTDECIGFITESKDKPWFAVLSQYLVHSPIQGKPEKVAHYLKKEATDQANPGYAAMVGSVDENLGRVLDTLEKLDLGDNTLVIFTSDNGGLVPITSNYPLMGGKSFPFEAGMRVPLIVKWPGRIMPGTSEQRVVGTDFYPTMLSAAGLPLRPQQHQDGVDLMPLLTEGAVLGKRAIIFHYPHYTHATGPFSAIVMDGWKLIRFYNDQEGEYLLYNLAEDPCEQNDLASTKPEKLAELAAELTASLTGMKAELPTPNPDYKPNPKALNLQSTLKLAKKERAAFSARLEK